MGLYGWTALPACTQFGLWSVLTLAFDTLFCPWCLIWKIFFNSLLMRLQNGRARQRDFCWRCYACRLPGGIVCPQLLRAGQREFETRPGIWPSILVLFSLWPVLILRIIKYMIHSRLKHPSAFSFLLSLSFLILKLCWLCNFGQVA